VPAKIVVSFYSMLAMVGQTFAIAWPVGFQNFLEAVEAVFTSIADTSALGCVVPINWFGKVCVWCGALVVAVGAIWLRFVCAARAQRRGTEAVVSSRDVDSAAAEAESELRAKYGGFAFNAALVLYPFLSPAAVAVFSCREVAGVSYLEADYSIRCDDDWYLAVAGSAVICVFYVVGLPVYCARAILRRERAVSHFSAGYRTDQGRIVQGWEVSMFVAYDSCTHADICRPTFFATRSGARDGAQVHPHVGRNLLSRGVEHADGNGRAGVGILPRAARVLPPFRGRRKQPIAGLGFGGIVAHVLHRIADPGELNCFSVLPTRFVHIDDSQTNADKTASFDVLLQVTSVAVLVVVITVPLYRAVSSASQFRLIH
jgi:hypothetical protein